MPTFTKLFREDHPPSRDRIVRVLFDETQREEPYFKDSPHYNLQDDVQYDWNHSCEIADGVSKNRNWTDTSGYEGASLTLVDVE